MLQPGSFAALLLLLVLAAPVAPQVAPQGKGPLAPAQLTPEARGDLAMIREEYATAIEFYRQAPQDSAAVWNKLGMAWHHLFAIDEAKRDYERALRLRPAYPEALNNLGTVCYAEKKYKKAVQYYRKALALDPKSATIYSNLGTAWFAEQHYDEGLVAYQKAFALDASIFSNAGAPEVNEPAPASLRAQQDYCIARIFAQSGKTDKALDFLRRALNEGFEDRHRLFSDETLASLRATP
ncbi:MAG: tetratricopeptide repeat protein, partial [Acidobacteriaceae bacterium]